MRTTLLILIILTQSVAFGQSHQKHSQIEDLRIIGLKQIPDTDIELSVEGLIVKFSRNLIIKDLEEWTNENNGLLDTLEYSKSEILKIKETLMLTRAYYNDKTNIKLIEPINIKGVDKNQNNLEYASLLAAASIIFHEKIVCKMMENGEFKLFSNGYQQKSITKAKVTENYLGGTDVSIRYFSQDNKEITKCCPCETILSNPLNDK
ncbi:hypothetical protein SDC9_55349 [bioreactor metagenome]|uniref:Uncharacterized protein n=1 Tax=bioreactor metagenome TaxID=1076179 RepID=A0A644X406_9ZZZZ